MSNTFQIFKGGYSAAHENRVSPVQRPADGHIKSAVWEDFSRLTKHRFKCIGGVGGLEVGDVIALHTTLTLGIIHGFGITVKAAEEGLEFKVVCSDPTIDLAQIKTVQYTWDEANSQFTKVGAEQGLDAFTTIGSTNDVYVGYAPTPIRTDNTATIGLEVVALPTNGLVGSFDIETRLQNSQPARPACGLVSSCC